MYQYKYISVGTGGGMFFNNAAARHREIIDQQAQEGWRYVGFVPLAFTSQGGISEMDLIFEKSAP